MRKKQNHPLGAAVQDFNSFRNSKLGIRNRIIGENQKIYLGITLGQIPDQCLCHAGSTLVAGKSNAAYEKTHVVTPCFLLSSSQNFCPEESDKSILSLFLRRKMLRYMV